MPQKETERFTTFAGSFDAGRPGYPPGLADRIFEGLQNAGSVVCADLRSGKPVRSAGASIQITRGDIVRRFATDETELRRAHALEAFARWIGWRSARRFRLPHQHILDAEGMTQRVKSTSYLPQKGPQSGEVMREANALFERYAQNGKVRMCLETIGVRAQAP